MPGNLKAYTKLFLQGAFFSLFLFILLVVDTSFLFTPLWLVIKFLLN
jgi:hypothetical protein